MHILIDARFLGTGTGIATYAENLIKNLAKIDKRNHYSIILADKYFNQFNFSYSNFTSIPVKADYYSIAEQTKLLWLIKKIKPDMVHFTSFNHPLFYRGKCIFTIHDLILSLFPPPVNPVKRLAYKITLKSAIKKADKIIAVSQNTKKDLQNFFNLKSNKIKVIYNGVNKPLINQKKIEKNFFQKKYGIKQDYLLYVGRFAAYKNIELLVKAFNLLIKEKKINYQLVLVGPKDKEYYRLEKLIADYKLKRKIIFTGKVDKDNLASLYKNATLFVLPSFYEGFGLPILEAMSYNIPVVCSSSSSLPEVAGKAALYFNPYDQKELAEKIYYILNNQELRKELIKKGRIQIKKFSWLKTAQETWQVYQSLLK